MINPMENDCTYQDVNALWVVVLSELNALADSNRCNNK
jgi:hypothetical protein